jgi:threonine dehydrogenase-like Zn-dependent dehydrogenase
MRAARCRVGGTVEVVDVDEPDGDGQLVRVSAVGICASDLLYLQWGSEQIIGHEIAGVLEDGTPVAIEGMFGCGSCEYCERGNYNLCATGGTEVLGMTVPGGMSEWFRAPERVIRELPSGLAPEDASLVEPGAVALHCCRAAGIGPDTRVAIVGGGAIGMLAVAASQYLGATEVAVEVRHPHQRELAEQFGAGEPTGLYDVVVEAAGSESAVHRSFELVRPQGTLGTVGVYAPDMAWPYTAALLKEVRTLPTVGYCGHDGVREFDEVAAMLVQRPEIAASLITHRFGIEDAPEAFELAKDRSVGTFRVVVQP